MINRLGLKDQNDNWIIGENTGTSTKYAAGSRITYERAGSKSAEKLLINGPTTEQLKVMVSVPYSTINSAQSLQLLFYR